ncbi:NAD(P)-dependent dehydrogenase (short-subunit alcohol dehydrogenase family) [Desulfosalsimonas propionicica]|uniref:NAD(P)-dependent dehydrogenase (Short-subunit alcohol dehydrogenase family) n=1 Tax=Desulfosalsimonas propionicica TaxID=332175 RepID=A0A7W0CB61_9BACT|nr:3-hydroxyacyl-CoA dehydrogenase [Desulfosalsimonas propionicica]MBA2882521.1 NAD(P)-dependent dehydrogenase (short-subunit alcohol dehydrogenase family) [Desulfosalsimonas propionicica]
MEISGNAFIVTGGASGLGAATVRALAAKGGRAAIFDLADDTGASLAEELGDAAIYCHTDVADETSAQDAVAKTIAAFGAVHGVINCAGIGIPAKVVGKNGPMPLDKFTKTIQVNLVGTFNVTRLAAAKMAENTPNSEGERGVVINTASVAAYEGQVGQAAYSASKAGIVGMTLPMAREFADHGIRVVTIAPGLFETPMFDALPEKARESLEKQLPFPSRFGRPAEFALMVESILANPVLNGETIRLDSAMRMQAR